MSNFFSDLNEKPLSRSFNCIDDKPKSNTTASTHSLEMASS